MSAEENFIGKRFVWNKNHPSLGGVVEIIIISNNNYLARCLIPNRHNTWGWRVGEFPLYFKLSQITSGELSELKNQQK